MSDVSIKLRSRGTQFFYRKEHGSLLDALEQHKVNIEYQCRGGYCGSCRTRLISGKVSYRQSPLAFIQPDEILPCCCAPQADLELDL